MFRTNREKFGSCELGIVPEKKVSIVRLQRWYHREGLGDLSSKLLSDKPILKNLTHLFTQKSLMLRNHVCNSDQFLVFAIYTHNQVLLREKALTIMF